MSATTQIASNKIYNAEVYTRSIALSDLALTGLALESQYHTELKLLGEVSRLSDPSLNAEQLLGSVLCSALQHIRKFYKADGCVAVIEMPDCSYVIYKAEEGETQPISLVQKLDDSIAAHLLAIPPQHSIFYTHQAEWCLPSHAESKPKEQMFETNSNFGEAISHLLEIDSFASVPLQLNEQCIGRLFVTNCSQYFNIADMLFLQQLSNQIKPQINHISLQNKVATTDAASTLAAMATMAMRQKISIDLHDSTIQPYIGLKLGIEALRRKIPEGAPLAAELDELVIMAGESIAELRQYVSGLKSQINSQPEPQLRTTLLDAFSELAKKYQLRHGIEVVLNADTQLKLSEHLSAEIYQLVCEGLSNIHRHTQSKKAEINLYDQHEQLVIEVINYENNTQNFIYFKPRSMSERVSHLGGTICVDHQTGEKTTDSNMLESKAPIGKNPFSKTIVTAKIPLKLIERRFAPFC